jgi:hypothetical protein
VPGDWVANSPNRANEAIFRQQMLTTLNLPLLPQNDSLYYSFDIQNYHFICLNTVEALHTDPLWGIVYFAEMSDEQYEWLQQDLLSNGNKLTIVYMHQPLWYNWGDWKKVHDLLRMFRVEFVIAGHFHSTQDDGLIDYMHYVTIGALGGNTKSGSSNAGDDDVIGLLDFRGQSVELKVFSMRTSTYLKLTPRHVMDKVKVIDYMLGDVKYNTYNFGDPSYLPSTLYYNHTSGILGDSCGSVQGISFGLILANPTEVDARYTIDATIEGTNYTFVSGYVASQIKQLVDNKTAILAAGKNTGMSNLATFQFSSWPPATVIWTASPIIHNIDAYGYLNVRVTYSFTQEQDEMTLYTDITRSIAICA